MTEEDWLAATDTADLFESEHLWAKDGISERKYRLFAVACCRRIWHLMPDELCRRAVEVSEKYADGLVTEKQLEAVASEFEEGEQSAQRLPQNKKWSRAAAFVCASQHSYRLASEAADHCSTAVGDLSNLRKPLSSPEESRRQCDLIRDMFHPFQKGRAIKRLWRTETVVALAEGIYAERAFDRMPILADALEDAGCDQADILAHCRGSGPHARGCWVVDLVLGRE